MNKPPMKSRSAAMDPAPPPHASWGVLGGGENLAETMIADQGLEEEAFLSARLGRVFQAERTGVEAPAMVSGEMASVVGAGEGAARRGERPEGKLHKINRKENGVRRLPPGEQRQGGKARLWKGRAVLFPWFGCGLEFQVSTILQTKCCLLRLRPLLRAWVGRVCCVLWRTTACSLGPGISPRLSLHGFSFGDLCQW